MSRKKAESNLRRLIDAAVSGRLTDDDVRQLDGLLREDDAALATFLDYCQLETDLFFHVRATLAGRRFLADMRLDEPAVTSTAASDIEPRRNEFVARRSWLLRSPIRLLASLAAAVVVGAFAWWASSYWYVIPAERQPQPIAALTEGKNAEWLDDMAPEAGHRFVEGDSVYLTKGHARISMSSGAELVLRGPCFVTLSTADRVQLEEGVVTAQVAEWGRGFTVTTEALRVVDLGTKFAVSASASGVAEAHVLDGQIRVQPTSSSLADRRSLLLSGGEAIRVESERHITKRLIADRKRYDAEMGSQPPFKPIQIFNTGAGLMPGDEDPHWRITAGPKSESFQGPEFAVVAEADVRYLANDPDRSQWVSLCNPVRPGATPKSQFTFECTFDLTGYDLSTVMVAAQVIADNGVRAVRINGQPVSMTPWELNDPQQYFNKFQVVEIKQGFVLGVNKVEFDVWNGVDRYAVESPNPMSLRVEWQAFGRPIQLAASVESLIHRLAQNAIPVLEGHNPGQAAEFDSTGNSPSAKRI